MRDYIEKLRADGDLISIKREVDPRFELAAVTRAAQRAGESALRFERVRGTRIPVVTNVYGSRRRLASLIGAEPSGFCKRFVELTAATPGSDCAIEVAAPDDLVDGRLSDLPQITYYERDAGPYLTSAIFLAKEPDTGTPNLSFHRAMIVDDRELRVRLGSTHDLARYQAKAEARGKALEAVLLIGAAPELFLAACASVPYEANELEVASQLAGKPLTVRRAKTVDLLVPLDAEVVIEGRILPNVRRPEGPFGEFMGYYVPAGDNHVFEVTHVSWRRGAVFHSLLCESPEDIFPLELAIATRVYRTLSQQVPGVLDVAVKSALLATIIKVKQQYEGHARHALLAAVGSHLDYNKMVIAVDEDVNIHDYEDVFWAYLTRGRADQRAWILNDIPGFYRDPKKDHWGRLLIDATRPLERAEEFERKRIPGEGEIRLSDYLVKG
jgi:4-hydroxybenzoate decarboxylase